MNLILLFLDVVGYVSSFFIYVVFVLSSESWYARCTVFARRTASETGDYRFCIDNSFSHYQRKLVYFEIYINDGLDGEGEGQYDTLPPEENDYEIKLEDFKVSNNCEKWQSGVVNYEILL